MPSPGIWTPHAAQRLIGLPPEAILHLANLTSGDAWLQGYGDGRVAGAQRPLPLISSLSVRPGGAMDKPCVAFCSPQVASFMGVVAPDAAVLLAGVNASSVSSTHSA